MREIFTRQNIIIEVDTEVKHYQKNYRWLFSVFIKFDPTQSDNEKYEQFLELKESLIIALEYDGNVKYVGSRVVDGWSEFYFYATTSKELNSMASAILQENNYLYESNVVKDSKWDFYFHHLLPTEEEFHHIQSNKIINLLKEEGDDLTTPREVEHYLSFQVPTHKQKFLENHLPSLQGFVYKDDISSEEFENGIALIKTHTVTEDEMRLVVKELFNEVKKVHGYYEGWSTTLVTP